MKKNSKRYLEIIKEYGIIPGEYYQLSSSSLPQEKIVDGTLAPNTIYRFSGVTRGGYDRIVLFYFRDSQEDLRDIKVTDKFASEIHDWLIKIENQNEQKDDEEIPGFW